MACIVAVPAVRISVQVHPWDSELQIAAKVAFFACLACLPVRGQDVQYAPEIDVHLKLSSAFRAYLETKNDLDGGAPNQLAIGPSIQAYIKPLIRLRDVTALDLDDSKSRVLVIETGYRYIHTPSGPPTNRLELVATAHYPLRAALFMTDRNRSDLDWKNGSFDWRYRNKLTIERTLSIRSYHPIPYIAAEPYYVSSYGKWSTVALYVGGLFPIGKRVEFNPYYEHQNNTGKSPNQQQNIFGMALDLYFP